MAAYRPQDRVLTLEPFTAAGDGCAAQKWGPGKGVSALLSEAGGAPQTPPGGNWVGPSWPLSPAVHCHPYPQGAEGGGERLPRCPAWPEVQEDTDREGPTRLVTE